MSTFPPPLRSRPRQQQRQSGNGIPSATVEDRVDVATKGANKGSRPNGAVDSDTETARQDASEWPYDWRKQLRRGDHEAYPSACPFLVAAGDVRRDVCSSSMPFTSRSRRCICGFALLRVSRSLPFFTFGPPAFMVCKLWQT